VAVQRLQATHVGQQTSESAKRHYRHHGEIAELSAAEDKVESLAPGVGKREETVDISLSFKRPEVIHLLLSKLQDFAGWTEGRKCGFVLKCENKVLRAHFKEYIGVVEEDQIVEEAVDEDDVSAAETEPSLERDGKVLLKLAKCFGKNADWLRQGAGDDVGKWRGIRIHDFKDELGGVRVCEINWSKESLHGDLGAAEKLWSKLNGLYYFDLSDNGLTGSILLGGLEYCQGLDLSRNNLSGDISCLDKLKRLKLERLKLVNGSKDRPDENFKEVSSVLCRLEFCCRTNRSALLYCVACTVSRTSGTCLSPSISKRACSTTSRGRFGRRVQERRTETRKMSGCGAERGNGEISRSGEKSSLKNWWRLREAKVYRKYLR